MREKRIEKFANRCFGCSRKPCHFGCPLKNEIRDFIQLVKEKKIEDACAILDNTTVLPSICGRICPHEKQCQGSCIRGKRTRPVQIGRIEAYLGDYAIEHEIPLKKESSKGKGFHVAVVGGGPAGLTCAAFLAKQGVEVTIYEKHAYLGGLLQHGIPSFRLNKTLLKKEIRRILSLGIHVKLNQELGVHFDLNFLEKKYDAVFLAVGANHSKTLGIEGEELEGVYGGNELLENMDHPNYQGKIVAIIGGGDVAMDVARTIQRKKPKKVVVFYRRSEGEMPAEKVEIKHAKKEGIHFLFQAKPVRILGKEKVEKIEYVKTKYTEKKEMKKLTSIKGSEKKYKVDYVIRCLGSCLEDQIQNLNLTYTESGRIKIKENRQTSKRKIFAGGDCADTMHTVAWASQAGKEAAFEILDYLQKQKSKKRG